MTTPAPPIARRDPVVITQLGRTRTDEFAWMKDGNWQKVLRDPSVLKPEIRQHLEDLPRPIPVRHPVQLLAESLAAGSPSLP